ADASPATLPYTRFVVATIGAPETLDPHWMYDTSSTGVAMQIYETLLTYRRESVEAFVPLLSTDWTISPDGRTYTFAIRQGVRFHAGGSLTPEDVAYSFWRGMLQDRANGPMWMLLDPLLGVTDIDDYPGTDATRCQAAKAAVTYDNVAGTVTFHLATPFGPFKEVLATPMMSILDKEWMLLQGDWDGSCSNWRAFNDPAADESVLFDQANGTGPYKLDYWSPNEVSLVRNPTYWVQEPLWDRGASGPAALAQVLIKTTVTDWPTRRDMLLNGQADFANVSASEGADLAPYLLTRYDGADDPTPTMVHPTGTLRLTTHLPQFSAMDLVFQTAVNTDTDDYVGSGQLDGAGIPPDFFADEHVRNAFNYALNWADCISTAYGGQAIQRRGPINAGLLGYDANQPTYFYSPTLSAYHFQQAWGGEVWTHGFSLTLAFNSGNTARQQTAEILKAGIEAITDTFHVDVVEMPYSTYSAEMFARRLPIYFVGWGEDFHHPHNWVYPYLYSSGTYGRLLGPGMYGLFDNKIDACKVLIDTAAASTCYAELQNMTYLSATHIFLVQPVGAHYERAEVRGWYNNPGQPSVYYYALSKAPLPSTQVVDPGTDATTWLTNSAGATVTLSIPADAVTGTTSIVQVPDLTVAERPGGFWFAGQSFALEAYQNDTYVPGFTFSGTVTLTLRYENDTNESSLVLYTWDGSNWVNAACGPYQRDMLNNVLKVPICHLSDFALFYDPVRVFVPIVLKNG
ncbi:MAG: ABC transporter substrate-binding protein, partial [Candidatus Eisenbacteria bacterium]|nr:ABC transporter substrate-binding protein [Candidatus Eisenbacteria bacterium]